MTNIKIKTPNLRATKITVVLERARWQQFINY